MNLRLIPPAVMLLLCAFGTHAALRGEYIFLRDGQIIEGTIVGENAKTVSVRKKDNQQETYQRENIMRILYTELYMGKVHVQKIDGKGVTGFMVDEDRNTYTFRKELNSPEEFTIPRDKVLFISRRNPAGLEGEAETDRIRLKWMPPYNQVKRYRLYIKGPGDAEFRKAAETSRKEFRLEDLKSNRRYSLYVTAVATEGDESLPSNVIVLTTKNIPPHIPRILPVHRTRASDGTLTTAKIQWAPSTDPDGKVEKYRVYALQGKEKKLVAETRADTFTVSQNDRYERVYVSAVDDMGAESGIANVAALNGLDMRLSVHPGMLYPLGKFGAVTGPGFGATAAFTLYDYLYENLVLGAELGFYYLLGKDALESEYKKTNTVFMAPLMLTAGYCFRLNETYSVIPYMSLGLIYFYSDLVNRDRVTHNERNETISEIGPVAHAGVMGMYRIDEQFTVAVRVFMGYLVGSDSGLYTGLDVGCIYRL